MEFVGECGSDTGGLTRELFRLFAKEMAATYIEPTGCFKQCYSASGIIMNDNTIQEDLASMLMCVHKWL